jgi:hypothetical protein
VTDRLDTMAELGIELTRLCIALGDCADAGDIAALRRTLERIRAATATTLEHAEAASRAEAAA